MRNVTPTNRRPALLLLAAFLAGCGGEDAPGAAAEPSAPGVAEQAGDRQVQAQQAEAPAAAPPEWLRQNARLEVDGAVYRLNQDVLIFNAPDLVPHTEHQGVPLYRAQWDAEEPPVRLFAPQTALRWHVFER